MVYWTFKCHFFVIFLHVKPTANAFNEDLNSMGSWEFSLNLSELTWTEMFIDKLILSATFSPL